MKKTRMAIHSDSSFNEAEEIRLLSGELEKNRNIKTFFKENDRTPNHDGIFELVDSSKEPIKQFIVQIKKVEGLNANDKGTYPYDLETKFLYYVKEKVVENPAIYFVVDITYHRIYYLYLSDEVLMTLDFEGKEKVRYHFSEKNILKNIDEFYAELNQIARERNKLFLNKSRKEIAIMQEALERLNKLMDTDLAVIKETEFPGLWRFGLASSETDSIRLTSFDKEGNEVVVAEGNAHAFGIYPQIKGVANRELSEYQANMGIMYSSFDFTDVKTVDDYVSEIIQKIVKQFCESPPLELLPDIVLNEIISLYRKRLYHSLKRQPPHTVKESLAHYNDMIGFVEYFFTTEHLSEEAKENRDKLFSNSRIRKNSIGIIDLLQNNYSEYEKYVHIRPEHRHIHHQLVVELMSVDDLKYYVALNEMSKRDIDSIERVWSYDVSAMYNRKNSCIDDVKKICNKWFTELPKIYSDFYNRVFKTPEYRYACRVKYSLEARKSFCFEGEWEPHCTSWVYSIPNNHEIKIDYQDGLPTDFDNVDSDVIVIGQGRFIIDYLKRFPQTLFYDGIRMWLYDGIMYRLGMKNNWKTLFEMPKKKRMAQS